MDIGVDVTTLLAGYEFSCCRWYLEVKLLLALVALSLAVRKCMDRLLNLDVLCLLHPPKWGEEKHLDSFSQGKGVGNHNVGTLYFIILQKDNIF